MEIIEIIIHVTGSDGLTRVKLISLANLKKLLEEAK